MRCEVGVVVRWKKLFLSVGFIWAEKTAFSERQKFSIYRKLYVFPSKASRFRNQNIACLNNFLLSSKAAFFTYKKPFIRTNLSLLPSKTILFCPPLPLPTALNYCPQKNSIFTNQKLSFAQTFPYCYPKLLFSTLRLPFAPPLTYSVCEEYSCSFSVRSNFVLQSRNLAPIQIIAGDTQRSCSFSQNRLPDERRSF